jgi:hypothetical protein
MRAGTPAILAESFVDSHEFLQENAATSHQINGRPHFV